MSRPQAVVARHPIISYVVLCYAITWPVWFSIPLVAGKEWTLIKIFVAVGLGPRLAAAVCGFIFASAAASQSRTLNSITAWRVPLRWWLTALFLPAALLGICLLIAVMTGETIESVTAGLPPARWTLFIVRAVLFTFMVVGVGEECGWRGWMLPELQQRFSPLVSSLIVGVVWGFWHMPLFVIGAYPGSAGDVVEYLFIGPHRMWRRTSAA